MSNALLKLFLHYLHWRLAHVPVGSFRHAALAAAIKNLDDYLRLEGYMK